VLTRYAAAFGIGCLIATTALAQSEPVEPHSKLAAKAWAETIMRGTDTRTIIGRPVIAVVNATGSGIEKITCQYKNKSWQLVGDSPYNSDNPHNIPAWKETEIDTKGFDDYCPVITATTRDAMWSKG